MSTDAAFKMNTYTHRHTVRIEWSIAENANHRSLACICIGWCDEVASTKSMIKRMHWSFVLASVTNWTLNESI